MGQGGMEGGHIDTSQTMPLLSSKVLCLGFDSLTGPDARLCVPAKRLAALIQLFLFLLSSVWILPS